MKWHRKMLTIILLISFLVGLVSFGVSSVSAAAPSNPPIPLNPQGDINICNSVLPSVTFNFTPVSGATNYEIQLSRYPDCSLGLVFFTPINSFTAVVNFQSGIWYWRVRAKNSDGNSPWSVVLSFHVIPSAPVLVSPTANGFVLPNPTFAWTTCFPLDTQFQLSNRPDFSNILIDVNFNASQYIYKGPYVYEYKFYWPLSCGMYWWRVRTKLGAETSSWVSQLFSIIVPPSIAPTIITPIANIIPVKKIDLKWSYINNADRYQIQICKGNMSIVDTVINTTEYYFQGEDNITYCFRVRAGNPVGWGPWSEWRQFKILLPPTTPQLIAPYNGITIQNTNSVLLTWDQVNTASSYLIQINDSIYETLSSSFNFVGTWNTTYYWRVKAKNISGESSWSGSWIFTIQENIPPRLEIGDYSQYTNQSAVVISGRVYDLESGLDALCLGQNSIPVDANGKFQITFNLSEGPNSFTIFALDKAGNKTQKTIDVYVDTIPPEINITFPLAPLYPVSDVFTVISDIEIKGTVKDVLPTTLTINNEIVPVEFGNFVYKTHLNYGQNQIYLRALDAAGNISEKKLLIYKTINPKFVFKINNPNIFVQTIDKDGKLTWDVQEIDPGRYTVPVIVKGRVFIPIRKFIELIGGSVVWDADTQKITIIVPARGKTIDLWIGKPLARVTDTYGKEQWIQIEKGDNSIVPFIKNGRSYFPLRFIVEQLNAVVEWDQVLQQVMIEFPIVP